MKKFFLVVTSLGLLLMANVSRAEDTMKGMPYDNNSQAAQNIKVVEDFYKASADQNDNNLNRFFAGSYHLVDLGVIKDVGSSTVKNLNVVKRIDNIRKVFPDFTIKINDIFATNNKVFADVTLTGHQKGQFLGIAPTDKLVNDRWFVVFDMQNGKIVKTTQIEDELSLMKQLGYIVLTK